MNSPRFTLFGDDDDVHCKYSEKCPEKNKRKRTGENSKFNRKYANSVIKSACLHRYTFMIEYCSSGLTKTDHISVKYKQASRCHGQQPFYKQPFVLKLQNFVRGLTHLRHRLKSLNQFHNTKTYLFLVLYVSDAEDVYSKGYTFQIHIALSPTLLQIFESSNLLDARIVPSKRPTPCSCTGYTSALTTDRKNILFETKAYMDSFEVHTSALITTESTYIPVVQPSLSSQ